MLKLDLGCGTRKREGYLGIDISPVGDIVADLFQFPWDFLTGSVSHIRCEHFFEHVPAKLRPKFMDEVWRVCAPGAEVVIITPHWQSVRAIQDFTHEWPPIAPESFLYFNAQSRRESGLEHMGIVCDFELSAGDINGDLLMVLKARK